MSKTPKLKIIIGHLGELLPFWCWRIDHRIHKEGWDGDVAAQNGRPRELSVTEYLKRNIYITTSGVFNTPALDHAMKVMGPDRGMYSVDYPYEDNAEANEWFKTLDYTPGVLESIAYGNAKKLLKL